MTILASDLDAAAAIAHEAYEAAAIEAGWLNPKHRLEWAAVPEPSRAILRASIAAVLDWSTSGRRPDPLETPALF